MADRHSTCTRKRTEAVNVATAPKEILECHWGRFYSGTREALIATGLFHADWFPGGPTECRRLHQGNSSARHGKRTCKVNHEGREIKIVRRSANRYDGYWCFTEPERLLSTAIAEMSCSASAFRRERIRWFRKISGMVRATVCSRSGGYRFGEDLEEEVEKHLRELENLLSMSPVHYSSATRLREIRALPGSDQASAAIAFPRFLARLGTARKSP
jgi:hypothetical protein